MKKVALVGFLLTIWSISFGSELRDTIERLAKMDRFGNSSPEFEKLLRESGFDVQSEAFQVLVPKSSDANIMVVNGKNKVIYPLWPNGVQTSACNLQGQLLFAGKGRWTDFSGKIVSETIVVLDYDSGQNWRNAATLGAKAILFTGNQFSRFESEQKWSSVSLDIPRFYVEGLSDSLNGELVRVKSDQKWVINDNKNYYFTIKGRNSKDWIMLSSYYDSISAIPEMSHGAEQSCGVASLIQIAKYFKSNPPKRNLIFVFTGAHFLAMQGMRDFVSYRMRDNWAILGGQPPRISVSLDISSRSKTIAMLGSGWWIDYRPETNSDTHSTARSLASFFDSKEIWDGVTNPDGRNFKTNIPSRFACEAELLNLGNQPAITFFTSHDLRPFLDSPADTIDKIEWKNLEQQYGNLIKACNILANAQEDKSGQKKGSIRLPEPRLLSGLSLKGGFSTISGKVLIFDAKRSFRPSVIVPGAIVSVKNNFHTYFGVRGNYMVTSDSEGRYFLKGLPVITAFPETNRGPFLIEAFKLDANQRPKQAIDFGQQSSDDYSSLIWLKTAYRETPLVLFDSIPVCFFSAVNPLTLTSLNVVNIFDSVGDNYARHFSFEATFGAFRFQSYRDTGIVAYIPKAGKHKFQLSELFGPVGMLLLNASIEKQNGFGFNSGEIQSVGKNSTIQAANDLLMINQSRRNELAKRGIVNSGIDHVLNSAARTLDEAINAQKNYDHATAIQKGREAMALGMQTYPILKSTARDLVFGLGFYLALLIPFSIFLERLLFQNQSIGKRSLFAGIIFSIVFLLFRVIHPAFAFAENTLVLYVSFIMGALSVMVITFLIGKFESTIQQLTNHDQKSSGAITTSGLAIGLSLTSMRRRKLRTTTTTLSIALATFCVICFASISPTLRFNEVGVSGTPTYPGILLRNLDFSPLEGKTADDFELAFPKGILSPRIWYYGAEFATTSLIPVEADSSSTSVTALLGLSVSEDKLTKISKAIMAGSYFTADDANEILLPDDVAQRLKLTPNDIGTKIQIAGVSFRLNGILDGKILKSIYDLDSESILPADFSSSRRLQNLGQAGSYAFRTYVRCEPSVIAIVPYRIALQFGGDLRCVAVGFENYQLVGKVLRDWMPKTGLNLYGGIMGENKPEIKRFSTVASSKTTGIEFILIPLAIAGLIVFNTMFTTVLERKREIGIFGAIGLNPKQIGHLFFYESVVYVVLGSVLGYLIAQGFGFINREFHWFDAIQLNFSSGSSVLATLLIGFIVLCSTIYPAKLSGKLASSGTDDDWTKQLSGNDEWHFDLPFTVSQTQSKGFLEHYYQWLKSHQQYMVGNFVAESITRDTNSVRSMVWLAPYDLGVQQQIQIHLEDTELENIKSVRLAVVRNSGDPSHWNRLNGRFLQEIRKTFLSWRTKKEQIQFESNLS